MCLLLQTLLHLFMEKVHHTQKHTCQFVIGAPPLKKTVFRLFGAVKARF